MTAAVRRKQKAVAARRRLSLSALALPFTNGGSDRGSDGDCNGGSNGDGDGNDGDIWLTPGKLSQR